MKQTNIRTRNVDDNDLDDVVAIHLAAFPGFLMSLLGPRFLRVYYQAAIDCRNSVFIGTIDSNERICSFVVGFAKPSEFYRLFGKRRTNAMLSAIWHVALRPSIWLRVLENIKQIQSRSGVNQADDNILELASIAVDPIKSGLGHGKLLVTEFLNRARVMLMREITLTTDAIDNDRVNKFYTDYGFECTGNIKRVDGRVMNVYSYKI